MRALNCVKRITRAEARRRREIIQIMIEYCAIFHSDMKYKKGKGGKEIEEIEEIMWMNE